MEYEFNDHIGIFDGYFGDLCDRYLEYFKNVDEQGLTYDRKDQSSKHQVDDRAISMFSSSFYNSEIKINYIIKDFIHVFFNQCYDRYVDEYSVLKHYDNFAIIDCKIQKTLPGQGYHVWHSEDGALAYRGRISAFSLYLNDVEEGGETEFLYQKKRFKPIKDRLLIWPASYTHAHRGNQPLSGEKYILTGWVEYGI